MREGRPHHQPVLIREVLDLLAPAAGQTVLDCTVGLGGHASLLAERIGPEGQLIGLDLDDEALAVAGEAMAAFGERVRLFQGNFSALDEALAEAGLDRVDLILADLGVNSSQLDRAERGFSFGEQGPLDMRLDPSQPTTAADLVNTLDERDLADLIWRYGQERHSRRIARRLCREREAGRITTTTALAELVCRAMRVDPTGRRSKIHPATRTFQALRIAVNGELDNLEQLLSKAPAHLNAGGRVAVISFHSLEDAMVKHDFRARAKGDAYRPITKRPVTASDEEKEANPRSRSAKLRVAERTEQPITNKAADRHWQEGISR